MDNGYFSEANIEARRGRSSRTSPRAGRGIIRVGAYFAEAPDAPPEEASAKEKMAYTLKTEVGKAIYRLRKCTVEPVLGIIQEVLGFRQFLLRGMAVVAGEWTLVCLGFNLKRMHRLHEGTGVSNG